MGIILSSERIRSIEKKNIETYGIGAETLMERAGFCVASVIQEEFPECDTPILVVCGCGNNGADGLVCARILAENGYPVSIYLKPGDKSELFNKNLSIINKISDDLGELFEFLMDESDIEDDYDVCVDALFGTGINRNLSSDDVSLIELINSLNTTVFSVDVPSGLNATTGEIYNACVEADITVSFATYKTGHFFNDGPNFCNDVRAFDIGLWFNEDKEKDYFFLDGGDISSVKIAKVNNANKGTYGKTLVLAGSDKIYGACFLSAKASLMSGAGMVKVFTHENNRSVLNKELPECLLEVYKDNFDIDALKRSIDWASTLVLGPGIGTDSLSISILKEVASYENLKNKIVILDADAINIISKDTDIRDSFLLKSKKSSIRLIMTPHKKELSRFMSSFNESMEEDFCKRMYQEYFVHIVNKDSKTRIYGERNYVNLTGNEGMATAGSGDVLAGIMGGLLYRIEDDDFTKNVSFAVYLHGLCGDIAKERLGTVSMTATDILNAIPKAFDFLT